MKWKTSMEIYASYIATGYSSLCQKLVFPYVWVSASMGQMYQPHPSQPTPIGSDSKTTPQEDDGLAIFQCRARKTSLGWINRKLQLLPWTSARASTEDGWRFQAMCSGCGCLPWQNGQQDHMYLMEGWTSTHRYQWIADWMTTMTAYGNKMHLQDHWCTKQEDTHHVRLLNVASSSTLMWNTTAQHLRDLGCWCSGGLTPSLHQYKTEPVQNWTNEMKAQGHA